MAWTAPVAPTTGTVITVAWAVANVVNPIGWLRLMTGNTDPPASDYVVRSTSTTSTVWDKINNAMLAANCISAFNILDGNITTGKYAPLSIDTAAIGNAQVTAAKVALNAIGAANIIDGNVTTAKFAVGAVDSAALGSGQVTTVKMADGNVTTVKMADGNVTSAKLDATISGKLVPSGLIAAFATAAAIAAGWTRYTALDGRIPVGDGTTFSQTFTQGNNYGSSWAHNHGFGGLTASSSVVAQTTTPQVNTNDGTGAAHAEAASNHDHPAPTITMDGSSANASWLPPMWAIVWAQKS